MRTHGNYWKNIRATHTIGSLLFLSTLIPSVSALASSMRSSSPTTRVSDAKPALGRRTSFHLFNPFVGEKEEAVIVRHLSPGPHRVPTTLVRFESGHLQAYATDFLRFVGHAHKELAYLNTLQTRVVSAIRGSLGLNASYVSVRVADGPNIVPSPYTNWDNQGAFIQEWKRRARTRRYPMAGLTGFAPADDTVIFLHRYFGAYDYQTRVHEVLHVLSQSCAREILGSKLDGLNEGLTQYFAYYVTKKAFGIRPDSEHPYYPHFLFAQKVARKIGHNTLRKLFFSDGNKLFTEMQRRYDGATPGRLKKEARALPDLAL